MILFQNDTFTNEACPIRSPHRHAFHELFWTKSGTGQHLLDGERSFVGANTVMLTGRGQIHHFEKAQDLSGAVIRFGAELLQTGQGSSSDPARMFTGRGVSTLEVPPEDADRFDSVVRALAAETRHLTDAYSSDIHRHLLMALISWAQRWYRDDEPRQPGSTTDLRLARRFNDLLERDFVHHHDVGHYARELHVSTGTLWRALSQATGHPPRTLITERVMLEAARLLRFTDLPVGEVAARVGIQDRLYFSRAFKGHYGESPLAYRARLHHVAG
ncbi:AraC family transcriptional regulator [Streptomyces sp. NPDC048636]|uniref:AraC family transcriptional regulator n=1 Tax=Streptomyces sp. NPDC048636 TaxID=3155762 RepID=UPI0034202CA0